MAGQRQYAGRLGASSEFSELGPHLFERGFQSRRESVLIRGRLFLLVIGMVKGVSVAIELEEIMISKGHDFKGRHGMEPLEHGVERVESVECVEGMGLRGDRFFGFKEDFKGQVTFIDRKTIEAVAERIHSPDLDSANLRRNIVVAGVDLNELIGRTFEVDGVRFSGSEECSPCTWMDRSAGNGAMETMKGRGGLRCRILNTGTLNKGKATLTVLD